MPTSGMFRCQLYRRISSLDKLAAGAFTPSVCVLVAMISRLFPDKFGLIPFPTAGDRRHDAYDVAVLHRRSFLRHVANVFVIQENIHETAEPPLTGKKLFGGRG